MTPLAFYMSVLTIHNRRQDGAWKWLLEHLAAKPYNPSTASSIKAFVGDTIRGNVRLNIGSLSPEFQFLPTLFFQFFTPISPPIPFFLFLIYSVFLLLDLLSPSSLFLISRPISVLLLLLFSQHAIRQATYVWRNAEAYACQTLLPAKALSITYSEWVSKSCYPACKAHVLYYINIHGLSGSTFS
jgi:hypothetical protein